MTFVYDDSNNIESFAEYQDMLNIDQRIFEANEGLSENIVYPLLIKATQRIETKINNSDWWKSTSTNLFDPLLILKQQDDFSDMCVYYALAEYILPKIADFGTPDNSEIQKMQYYQNKFEQLFDELVSNMSWYDFNQDGSISTDENKSGSTLRKRIR